MMRRLVLTAGAALLLLSGCGGGRLRPLAGLNQQLNQLGQGRSPSLSGGWLALIAARGSGRVQVQLIDVKRRNPSPCPAGNDRCPANQRLDENANALPSSANGRTAPNWCSPNAVCRPPNRCPRSPPGCRAR